MKLNEVSTGKSTLLFADYLKELKSLRCPAKTIGELHTIGVNLLKAGASFERSDEDEVVKFVTPFFEVMIAFPLTTSNFRRVEVGAEPNQALSIVSREVGAKSFGYYENTTTDRAAGVKWGELVKSLAAYQQAVDAARLEVDILTQKLQ